MHACNQVMQQQQQPILSLQASAKDSTTDSRLYAQISSLCFLPLATSLDASRDCDDTNDSDSSSSSLGDLRCGSNDGRNGNTEIGRQHGNNNVSPILDGRYIIACTLQGTTPLFNLKNQRQLPNAIAPRLNGLSLRRVCNGNDTSLTDAAILYHSRDEKGTVSLHDINHTSTDTSVALARAEINTYSRTFCAASPCTGDGNLVALPCYESDYVSVRDWRVSSKDKPVLYMHAEYGLGAKTARSSTEKLNDMLTSLSMTMVDTARPMLACGMESGKICYHDIAMVRSPAYTASFMQLSSETVLSMDIRESIVPNITATTTTGNDPTLSFVTVAGQAGNRIDQSDLPEKDRGTIAVIKSTFRDDATWESRLRVRLSTCSIDSNENEFSNGKPGINTCRFRPDGRIFAVGGWDRRLRIFDRSAKQQQQQLALFRAHSASVSAVDWASDSAESGLIATGAADGQICVWKCFGKV